MSARPGRWGTAIVWFRRDLRLDDHPALSDAVSRARRVIPLFVLDPRLLGSGSASPTRTWFLARSLAALDEVLRERGSGLIVRVGRPEAIVPAFAAETSAEVVLVSRDVTPFARRRDRAVSAALAADGRAMHGRAGLLLAEPEAITAGSGRPYGVFTPFWRALASADRRPTLDAPLAVSTPPGIIGPAPLRLPAGLDRSTAPAADLPTPGEPAARARLARWVARGLAGYAADRDRLDGSATSRLGQDLHLGLLSPRRVEEAVTAADADATAFVRQLAWREFYHHLAYHSGVAAAAPIDGPLASVFRPGSDDPAAVAAWREGRTGIPVVDAGMRQLAVTGWIGNRARLVVASFLTRHLLMDPRIGEVHFLRHLIDGDVANNAGGWRWTAGVGADPQPWFRIFNPVLQGERFDPGGRWVRSWVPELARVPDDRVHAPWRMDPDEARRGDVRIGEDYPAPVVDLAEGRERALAAFRSAVERRAGAGR